MCPSIQLNAASSISDCGLRMSDCGLQISDWNTLQSAIHNPQSEIHYNFIPPSTRIAWPVMYLESSEARNNARAAISSGNPSLPIGCRARKALCASFGSGEFAILLRREGVSTVPGQMQLTRM